MTLWGNPSGSVADNRIDNYDVGISAYDAALWIVGNTITRQDVILKAVGVFPGQLLHYPDLRLAEKNLEQLGIFARDAARGIRPTVTVLDPDGDLVDYLHAAHRAQRHLAWACYHTQLDTFVHEAITYGIVGRVVGAPFAVLVAEELFASGCRKAMQEKQSLNCCGFTASLLSTIKRAAALIGTGNLCN